MPNPTCSCCHGDPLQLVTLPFEPIGLWHVLHPINVGALGLELKFNSSGGHKATTLEFPHVLITLQKHPMIT